MPAGAIKEKRTKAGRYRGEDDEDDGTAIMAAATGPPAMCAVFTIPDEDEADPDDVKRAEYERKRVVGKLRALNLNVDEYRNKTGTLMYLKISAPDSLLRYEAESQKLKLRLTEELGGSMCAYTSELEDKNAFDKPLDGGHPLFCSAHQLAMIRSVIGSPAYAVDKEEETDVIDFDALMDGVDSKGIKKPGPIVAAFFPLHHERIKLKLLNEWARATDKPQPLHLIREYFGSKIALYFTFFGFYCTMLWIPGLAGGALFIMQLIAFLNTGSMETPYDVVYAVLMCVWSSLFYILWRQLENTRKYQWDTVDYEDMEGRRKEFMDSDMTVRSGDEDAEAHINEVTGELDEYWYDEGSFFPPTGRCRSKILAYAAIILSVIIYAFVWAYVWVNISLPLMTPGNVVVGALVQGVINNLLSFMFALIWDGVGELEISGLFDNLTHMQNWKTDTQYEDSLIFSTFYLKIVTKYFGIAMVAFFVNHVELLGDLHQCPDYQCFSIVQTLFCVGFIMDVLFSQLLMHVVPAVNKYFKELNSPAALQKAAGIKVTLTPQEEQFGLPGATPVVDLYMHLIYQFGYIAMFAQVFPLMVALALVVNLFELRAQAASILSKNRRPPLVEAEDIGSYAQILEVSLSLSLCEVFFSCLFGTCITRAPCSSMSP